MLATSSTLIESGKVTVVLRWFNSNKSVNLGTSTVSCITLFLGDDGTGQALQTSPTSGSLPQFRLSCFNFSFCITCIYDGSPFFGTRQRVNEHFALRYMVPLFALYAHVISGGEGTQLQIYARVLGKNVQFFLGESLIFTFLQSEDNI